MPARLQVLARLPLFANLTEYELMDILTALEEGSANSGVTLIAEGAAPGSPLYILWQGSTATVKTGADGRAQHIATLNAPGIFGEMDILATRPPLASVVSLEPVCYATLSSQALRRLCEAARPSVLKLLTNLATALRYRTHASESRLLAQGITPLRQPTPRLGSVRQLLYNGWDSKRR